MRLTSKRDMISGAILTGAGLMFHLGATFGRDPPQGFFEALRSKRASVSQPADARVIEGPSPVIVASFLDQPAPISEISVGDRFAGARINLRLGPGAVDPRFSLARRDGVSQLKVEGLGAPAAVSGPGGGLVDHWSLGPGGKQAAAVFSLKQAARIDRVFLDDTRGAERYLVLDLTQACPTSSVQGGAIDAPADASRAGRSGSPA